MARPVLLVLAGVNGAGKSSIGGHLLRAQGIDWYNPDAFAHELREATDCELAEANAEAWQEGMRRLDAAVEARRSFAFETTLGGNTVPAKIAAAAATHDVIVWFVGLASPEQHIARVALRVGAGGHPIPEAKIRERWVATRANLIALMPSLAELYVFDNSVDVARGKAIPDPVRVLEMVAGAVAWPVDYDNLSRTPAWAKPLVEAALVLDEDRRTAAPKKRARGTSSRALG
jgi:predicted ABC-type ATPase